MNECDWIMILCNDVLYPALSQLTLWSYHHSVGIPSFLYITNSTCIFRYFLRHTPRSSLSPCSCSGCSADLGFASSLCSTDSVTTTFPWEFQLMHRCHAACLYQHILFMLKWNTGVTLFTLFHHHHSIGTCAWFTRTRIRLRLWTFRTVATFSHWVIFSNSFTSSTTSAFSCRYTDPGLYFRPLSWTRLVNSSIVFCISSLVTFVGYWLCTEPEVENKTKY